MTRRVLKYRLILILSTIIFLLFFFVTPFCRRQNSKTECFFPFSNHTVKPTSNVKIFNYIFLLLDSHLRMRRFCPTESQLSMAYNFLSSSSILSVLLLLSFFLSFFFILYLTFQAKYFQVPRHVLEFMCGLCG